MVREHVGPMPAVPEPGGPWVCFDGGRMARTVITLGPETWRRARRRASDLGVSLAEYVRRLVERDLGTAYPRADVCRVFDLGKSGGSDVAGNKDALIAEAITSSLFRTGPFPLPPSQVR